MSNIAFLLPATLIAIALTIVTAVAVCVYRLFFHPLAKFPGPKFAAVANIWYGLHWTGGRYVYDIDDLHKKYGDVVRIAPNDLSFSTLESWKDIYGHASAGRQPFLKSDWYTRFYDLPGVVSAIDPVLHREIRKDLSFAFSAKALREQTDLVQDYINRFLAQIDRLGAQDQGINMEMWFNWITFDVMGELAFGESFGAVDAAKSHFWIDMLVDSTYAGSLADVFGRMPASMLLAPFLLPRDLLGKKKQHDQLTEAMIVKRMNKPNNRADFFSHLLSDKNVKKNPDFFMTNASTLIVAGSETTATTLYSATYFTLTNPHTLRCLQEEVRGAFSKESEINQDSTQGLQYLMGVIDESLRVFPPAAFGLQRTSYGAMVSGYYVPKGTTVSTATYTVSRQERYFHDAENFRPERWLPEGHALYDSAFAKDQKEASKPFSTGPRGCLGINLAYLQIRIILARMVFRYDWELITKDIDWKRDTKIELLWKKPHLMVKYTPVVKSLSEK